MRLLALLSRRRLLTAAAVTSGKSIPTFAQVLARAPDRLRDPLRFALGAVLVVTGVLALERALVLTFDPRYIDFSFAPLTAAALPYLVLAFARGSVGVRGAAEVVMA